VHSLREREREPVGGSVARVCFLNAEKEEEEEAEAAV